MKVQRLEDLRAVQAAMNQGLVLVPPTLGHKLLHLLQEKDLLNQRVLGKEVGPLLLLLLLQKGLPKKMEDRVDHLRLRLILHNQQVHHRLNHQGHQNRKRLPQAQQLHVKKDLKAKKLPERVLRINHKDLLLTVLMTLQMPLVSQALMLLKE